MSEDAFYVDVVGGGRIQNFDRQPVIVQAILLAKVKEYTERMRDIAGDLLDQRLGTKTGRLTGDDIEAEVKTEGREIRGRVFLRNVPYGRIQEQGGKTSPHMIYPKNAKVLAFYGATGEKVLATRVFHPGAVIEGKHFMRDARRQLGPEISRGLKKSLVEGIRQNMRAGS